MDSDAGNGPAFKVERDNDKVSINQTKKHVSLLSKCLDCTMFEAQTQRGSISHSKFRNDPGELIHGQGINFAILINVDKLVVAD